MRAKIFFGLFVLSVLTGFLIGRLDEAMTGWVTGLLLLVFSWVVLHPLHKRVLLCRIGEATRNGRYELAQTLKEELQWWHAVEYRESKRGSRCALRAILESASRFAMIR